MMLRPTAGSAPACTASCRPTSFTPRWTAARPGSPALGLNDILRSQLVFAGAIFSDDLSMAGARVLDGQQLSYTQAAIAALQAGCDMVLLCNQSLPDSQGGGQAIDELLAGLTEALIKGHWEPRQAS